MESLLLMLSFLIHIILMLAVYQLYKQSQKNKQQSTEDLIELFDTYLEEIREENRILQKSLDKERNRNAFIDEKRSTLQDEINYENEPIVESDQEEQIESEVVISSHSVKNEADQYEASLESQILFHYKSGLTVDDIAKKLNCGKTEVELMLKLHPENN